MSYNFDTSKTSPNSTPGSESARTFGRPRTIEKIAIHHWGAQTATYEGTVATLMNPAAGVSAHFVATGTGRRVAQLVDFGNVSWATNSANPYTISIECDPRCRDEDYDVVAEVIAQIRDAFGDLGLVPHRNFVATACPGNWDLNRLDQLARTKDGSGNWGTVTNKNATPPTPPAPAKKPVPAAIKLPAPITIEAKLDKVELWDLDTNPNYVSKKTFNKGDKLEVVGYIEFNGTRYYQTEYSFNRNKQGINQVDVNIVEKPTPETPSKPIEEPSKPSEPETGVTEPSKPKGASEGLKTAFAKFIELLKEFWNS